MTTSDTMEIVTDDPPKFTPGPWSVLPDAPNGVARGSFFVGAFQRPEDARFVAAAPEVYEALRGLIQNVRPANWEDDLSEKAAWLAADAALAKAEGKAASA